MNNIIKLYDVKLLFYMINIIYKYYFCRKKMDLKNQLKSTFLFSDLTDTEFSELETKSTEVHYKKGDTIYKQGSYCTHAIYVMTGYAIVYQDINNIHRIIKIIKPNWFIGLMSIFSTEKHLFSAMAIEDSTVRFIEIGFIQNLLNTNKEFNLKFIKELSLLSSSLTQYLVTQNAKNVRGRIAEILVHLSENIFKNTTFSLIFTRKELGALANTSTETAIRVINEFKKEGVIEINDRQIVIKDIILLKKAISLG